MTFRSLHCVLAVTLLWLTMATAVRSAHGQESDSDRLTRLQAAFLLNFLKYTQWPDGAFPDTGSPIVVSFVGGDGVRATFTRLVANTRIGNRAIAVQRLEWPDSPEDDEARERLAERLRQSHMVFIGSEYRPQCSRILPMVAEHPVLTTSDIPRFAEIGGMLGFAVRDNRLAFDANPEVIKASGLEVSSKLLRLARIVKIAETSTP